MNAPPAAEPPVRFDCVRQAWCAHEAELRGYLARQSLDASLAEDLLQEVFLKSLRQGQRFCSLDNPRAWLYQVARTTLIDHSRAARPWVELPEDLVAPAAEERAPVETLDVCLLRNLTRLSDPDRAIVQACDLNGQTLRHFSQTHGLSLSAAKSRLLRARLRLRQHLVDHCGVEFDASGQVCCHSTSPTP